MSSDPAVGVITLRGELDVARKHELRAALGVAKPDQKVLVDLAGVTYADSTALSELLRFSAEAQNARVRVALLAHAPQFLRIIEFAGLTHALHVFTDRDRALEYLRTEP